MIYRKNFTLSTEIIGFDLEASNGWTPDCQSKQDYDPVFVEGSSRVYPDGMYICSIEIGETTLLSTEVLTADSVDAAKIACQDWMELWGTRIRTAVVAAVLEAKS